MNNLRQRYILVEFLSKSSLDVNQKKLKKTLWNNYMLFFGELNSYKAGIWIADWNSETQQAIIRCDHNQVDKMIAMLTLTSEIDGIKVICHTWKTTGTIKKAKKLWNSYNPEPWK